MQTKERVVVDFRGDMTDVKPRRLWQQLFDFYRANGGRIEMLDNLLIDFENCQQILDRCMEKGPQQFIWGFDPGNWLTTWVDSHEWEEGSYHQAMFFRPFSWYVHCELTKEEAVFTIQQPPEILDEGS